MPTGAALCTRWENGSICTTWKACHALCKQYREICREVRGDAMHNLVLNAVDDGIAQLMPLDAHPALYSCHREEGILRTVNLYVEEVKTTFYTMPDCSNKCPYGCVAAAVGTFQRRQIANRILRDELLLFQCDEFPDWIVVSVGAGLLGLLLLVAVGVFVFDVVRAKRLKKKESEEADEKNKANISLVGGPMPEMLKTAEEHLTDTIECEFPPGAVPPEKLDVTQNSSIGMNSYTVQTLEETDDEATRSLKQQKAENAKSPRTETSHVISNVPWSSLTDV